MQLLFLLSVCFASPLPQNAVQNPASWMGSLASVIGTRKLNQIDIPGAHHAGFLSTPWFAKPAEIIAKCQTEGITALLNRGARYLDLRIAERKGTLYFSHTVLSEQRWNDGLNEIKTWINNHPTEILILDIVKDTEYKFSNSNTAYENVPRQLRDMFGGMIISTSDYEQLTAAQLVSQNKRIALVGDSGIRQIPRSSSWGATSSGNWGTVNTRGKVETDKVIEWLPVSGRQNIAAGVISVSSAAVSPGDDKDFSPPLSVASKLNENLAARLPNVPGRIGVIEVDQLSDNIVKSVIDHNKVQ